MCTSLAYKSSLKLNITFTISGTISLQLQKVNGDPNTPAVWSW